MSTVLAFISDPQVQSALQATGAGLLSWALTKLLSIERRLTRIETKLGCEKDENEK